jgi:hypothetical protein
MKKMFTLISLATCLQLTNAQTVLFSENFEISPVTSIINSFGGNVPDGPSPCGQASRGTTTDFNSGSVNFQNTQNNTYFVAVNPQTPCGGF